MFPHNNLRAIEHDRRSSSTGPSKNFAPIHTPSPVCQKSLYTRQKSTPPRSGDDQCACHCRLERVPFDLLIKTSATKEELYREQTYVPKHQCAVDFGSRGGDLHERWFGTRAGLARVSNHGSARPIPNGSQRRDYLGTKRSSRCHIPQCQSPSSGAARL